MGSPGHGVYLVPFLGLSIDQVAADESFRTAARVLRDTFSLPETERLINCKDLLRNGFIVGLLVFSLFVWSMAQDLAPRMDVHITELRLLLFLHSWY